MGTAIKWLASSIRSAEVPRKYRLSCIYAFSWHVDYFLEYSFKKERRASSLLGPSRSETTLHKNNCRTRTLKKKTLQSDWLTLWEAWKFQPTRCSCVCLMALKVNLDTSLKTQIKSKLVFEWANDNLQCTDADEHVYKTTSNVRYTVLYIVGCCLATKPTRFG